MLLFPENYKNMHLDTCSDYQSLLNLLQLSYCKHETVKTLRVYEVDDKSLSKYRPKDKYGLPLYPREEFRMYDKEIKGTAD